MKNRPYLVIEFGADLGKVIVITSDSMLIGRDSSCNIPIINVRISRRHARIFFLEGNWMIEDLGSTNHTWVDRIKLIPGVKKKLTSGNRIQLASQVTLCFHDPDSLLAADRQIIAER